MQAVRNSLNCLANLTTFVLGKYNSAIHRIRFGFALTCAVWHTHATGAVGWWQVSRLCLAKDWPEFPLMNATTKALSQKSSRSRSSDDPLKQMTGERGERLLPAHTETCDVSSLIRCRERTKFRIAAAPSIFKQHGWAFRSAWSFGTDDVTRLCQKGSPGREQMERRH